MNQRFDPKDNRPLDPTAWPADATTQRGAPLQPGAPLDDPRLSQPSQTIGVVENRSRSVWPLLIILLAGIVLALLVWLPAEVSNTPAQPDGAATQPAPVTQENTTPPAADNNAATPAAPAPEATAPDTGASGAAPQAAPATPDTMAPATGNDAQPQTNGAAPQTDQPATQN